VSEETPVTEAELQAYADDRLAPERRAAVEAWLAVRTEDAERVADFRRLGGALRATFDPLLEEPVPAHLERAARRSAGWRRYAVAAACAALGFAVGVPAGWQLSGTRLGTPSASDAMFMARRAAIAHVTYSPEVSHPVEVGADQEAHLVAWLSKRLGVRVRAPKLEEAGLGLVGGRLLPGESGPVAHFMYQTSNGRRLTMYVRAEASKNRETAFRYSRENNVGVFYWIDRDCGYALASADLTREELLNVATLVYKQLEP
jgi:anti-sigma factor RsiW